MENSTHEVSNDTCYRGPVFTDGRYMLKKDDDFLCRVPMGPYVREYSKYIGDACLFSVHEMLALKVVSGERWVLDQRGYNSSLAGPAVS